MALSPPILYWDPKNVFDLKITCGKLRKLTKEEKKNCEKYYKYVTVTEFSYEEGNKVIIIPPGFLTDGITYCPFGNIGCSGIFHDYLYATHKFTSGQPCTRKEADDIMCRILRRESNMYLLAIVRVSFTLNPGNILDKNWKISGDRGASYLKEGYCGSLPDK